MGPSIADTRQPADGDGRGGQDPRLWMGLLLVASLLLVLPSASVWTQDPMRVIEHEFDLLLGVLDRTALATAIDLTRWGKWAHFVGFAVVGALFYKLVTVVRDRPDSVSTRALAGFASLMTAIFFVGVPWVSPDVFFYIGTGWLDGHHHLSPYTHPMNTVPDYRTEPMFQNVFSTFRTSTSSYGPLFHVIASGVAVLSFGSPKLALLLFKLVNVGAHAACSVLAVRMARPEFRKQTWLLYAANPLVLFALVTCVHNDALMVLPVVVGFAQWRAGRPFLSGVAFGVATAIKYVPLLFLPFVCVSLVLAREPGSARPSVRIGGAVKLVAGVASACAASYALYPEALNVFFGMAAANGPGVIRNSIFDVFLLWKVLGWEVSANPGWWTFRVFLVGYAALLLVHTRDTLLGRRADPVQASLLALTLYFTITMQSVQEWYVPWLLALVVLLDRRHFFDFGLWLSAAFLPLVIFTVRYDLPKLLMANLAIYVLVVAACVRLWSRVAEDRRADAT